MPSPRFMSKKGERFLMNQEGTRRNAAGLHVPYICPAGKWTLGYGEVITAAQAQQFKEGITDEYAAARFNTKLRPFVEAMDKAIKVEVMPEQFDMVVSIAYNNGIDAIAKSTLMRKLNAKDFAGAAKEFLRWNHIGTKVCDGLTARRKREMQIFTEGYK